MFQGCNIYILVNVDKFVIIVDSMRNIQSLHNVAMLELLQVFGIMNAQAQLTLA